MTINERKKVSLKDKIRYAKKISYYVLHCGSSLVNRNGNPIALSNESKVKVLTKTPLKLRVKGESSFALW